MGPSNAIKLVLLLVIFTITATLALHIASAAPDSNDQTPSRNVSSSEGERSLMERMLRARRHRHRHRHRRAARQPRRARRASPRPRPAQPRPLPRPLPAQPRPKRLPRGPRRPMPVSGSPDAVVAQDGSGNFATIKLALDSSLRRGGARRFVIHIKRGVYRENLVVSKAMTNIMITGDGREQTIITGSLYHNGQNRQTWNSATVVIEGDGFVARDITFQNTYNGKQAPAVTVRAAHSAFYRCGFDGYQDTVYAMEGLQFYKECDIYGTVDFICGDATAVFQNSNIFVRKSATGNQMTITANHRNGANSPTGFVFHNCRIMAAPDRRPVPGVDQIYLGRPWGAYSRVVYIQNDMDVPIHPQGWLEWDAESRGSRMYTVYYGEFGNRGIGASTQARVRWPGYRVMGADEANQFTVANHIKGNTWLPDTGVPFVAGL